MRRGSCRALGREIRGPAIGGRTIGRAARRRGHDQRPLARSRSGHHLDRPGALPALASGARLLHERVRYGTVADVQDLVGTVLAQPGDAVGPDREANPSPPMQPPVVAGQRLNRHLALDARDAPQLLADHGRLEAALRVEAGVLPAAAATTARPGVPAAD